MRVAPTGRWTPAVLAAIAATAAGCQLVFGLGDYAPRPVGQGGAGGASASSAGGEGDTSTSTSDGTGAAGGGASCAALAPEPVVAGSTAICGVRRLDALSDPTARELAPGAYCQGAACFVYFERRKSGSPDALMCSLCSDLDALACDPPVTLAAANNPYLRVLPAPEIWVSQGGHLQHALVNQMGSCTLAKLTTITGAVDTGGEIYPAISPNGKVLLFTRNDPVAKTERIHIARRSDPTGAFDAEILLPGLRDGVAADVHDLRAEPVWLDGAESFDTVYFSSTRLSADPTTIDEMDVFVAHRAVTTPFDAPFTEIHLVAQLSGPYADFAPVPLSPSKWLWSAGLVKDTPDADLYVIDLGCKPLFEAPAPGPYAGVDAAGNDETAPAIRDDALYFARAAPGGYSGLYLAMDEGGGFADPTPVPGLATPPLAFDRDPLPLADGRLLFVSNRDGGVPKIWIAQPDSPALTRATAEPAGVEEGTPFVDAEGTLWLSWAGGSDPAGVIATAEVSGAAWGNAAEMAGLVHVKGARDEAPRLSADGRTLMFASTRKGGFFPGVSTLWAATRPDPASQAWAVFPIPELGSVNGVTGPWPSPDGCAITFAAAGRETGFRRDLQGALRVAP